MNVLVIDNNILPEYWGANDLRRSVGEALAEGVKASGAKLTVLRGPHSDLPNSPRGLDRIVISGSKTSAMEDAPWIATLEKFILSAIEESIPLLGVCYGHQMITRAIIGKRGVGLSKVPEFGWTPIRKKGKSRLLEGLPDQFFSFSAHFDEVKSLPGPDFITTSASEDCAVQSMEHKTKAIFGIQFHPERNAVEGDKSLVARKKMGQPKRLLGLGKGNSLYQKEVGEVIFRNFLLLK